ncbi:MAG: hypothetical protein K2M12_04710 [Muribaculaceae bacterium]|nr:hypothetical protein [Muribaculaceae bacterium]
MKDTKKSKPVAPAWKTRLAAVPVAVWIALLFLVFAWIALPVRNGIFLRWMEDCSLFEPTQSARDELLRYPGGLLQYAGSYLMQFMHIPRLGSAILFALWMLLAFLTARCFRLSRNMAPLVLLLPVFLLESILVLDEAWLTILYKGYLFAPTLGFIAVAALTWCFRLARPWWAAALTGAATVLLYPWLGFYALLAGGVQIVITLLSLRQGGTSRLMLVSPVVTAILIGIIPLLYFRHMGGTWVEGRYLWLKGLPDLMMNANDAYLLMPFVLTSALLLLLPLAQVVKRPDGKTAKVLSVGAVIVAGMWCSTKVAKSAEWRAGATMQLYMDRLNWQEMVRVADSMEGPIPPDIALLATIARAQCGMPPVAYNVSQIPEEGSTNLRKKPGFLRTIFLAVPADYFMGEPNRSYRWGMEHSVKYGHRAFLLKYMVRDCILNGDYELARHYNDMLARTLFHRKWSERYGRLIDNPDLIPVDPELGRIYQDEAPDVFYH